jgi:hypothetical protein
MVSIKQARAEYQFAVLPKDFECLNTDQKLMVCEIVQGLLRLEKR